MWVTAATFSIRKTRYCRNSLYRKIMHMSAGYGRRTGSETGSLCRLCGAASRTPLRAPKTRGRSRGAALRGKTLRRSHGSGPGLSALRHDRDHVVSAVPQCMSEAGSDGALLRRPGCDRGFMEHEGASAMAARCHDSTRLHCGTQRLQFLTVRFARRQRRTKNTPASAGVWKEVLMAR